jgi:RNA polymerase sigma-70 factor (ECF subfamily)
MMAVAPDSIDDVAQEIFIEAYRSIHHYEDDRPFLKWIRGIARNVVRRHAERQSRESQLRLDAVSILVRQRREAAEASLERAEESPESPLGRLRQCLEKLPEHLRRLLRLHYGEQMTSATIAESEHRSADAVRMTLMRTRLLLLACLRSSASGEGAAS